VVKAELNTIDVIVEDFFDTVCSEAGISDYKDYYKIMLSDKIREFEVIREFYVFKTGVEITTILVKVVVQENNEFTLAKAHYLMTSKGCYKYHKIMYDELMDATKAIITNSLVEAGEVESGE
jgi:hypothetical protein